MRSLNKQVERDRAEPTAAGEIFNWTHYEFELNQEAGAIAPCGEDGLFTF